MTATVQEKALYCTVVSLIPWNLREFKPGLLPGYFDIPASDTNTPSVFHVSNKTIHYVYLDEARGSLPARDPSDEVAASIVRDFIGSQLGVGENARPGLFWLPGYYEAKDIPKEKVAEEKEIQKRWFLNLCRIADDDWTRYRKHTVIADFQRTAAELIGWNPEEHEWMKAEIKVEAAKEALKLCIACNSPVSQKAIICSVCKCILDPEAFKKLTFAGV